MTESALLVAKSGNLDLSLPLALANRHGCITGATGTGKTVTLQRLAEGFSRAGVPVFMADVKGDLSGISEPGCATPKVSERLSALQLPEPTWEGCPTLFWDVWGEQGSPIRATVSDLGPVLFARLLQLNETQAGVLSLAFRVADEEGMLVLDLKDLRALIAFIGENAARLRTSHGNVTAASIGAIQRGLLQLEEQGAEQFFGEPMLDIADLMHVDGRGRGFVNVLAADKLLQRPRLYSTLLLWLLSELFENLPEAGDLDKPKLVFFFDEAHLLFDAAPPALLEKIEQVVRLIRSKGVGVYFVTQSPLDIPDGVLGQLGQRVQHALRAFTKRDQKAVKAVAETMRPNPAIDAERAIQELGVGEVLISLLDARGTPSITERALVVPPLSRIGPVKPQERAALRASSPLGTHYDEAIDRESAYERLTKRVAAASEEQNKPVRTKKEKADDADSGGALHDILFGSTGPRGGRRDGLVDTLTKSAARSAGSAIAREITRGVLGSLFGGSSSRRRR